MATTINSGYASSPKLTANIADHADVYGGRALVFDGVTDALNIERDFAGAFSISFWIKPHDVTDSGKGVFGISPQDSHYIRQFSQALAIRINSAGSTYSTGNVLANNVWTFLVITRDDSNVLKWYVDGEYIGSSATQSGTFQTDYIGRSASAYFDGAMCDVKYYDVALSESDITSQYIKPESVPNQDNLVAWYPMIEGNPESPQSIVYDHSEKKLGSELVTNGTFDSDISNWTDFDSARGDASWSNGRLRIDNTTGTGNYYIKQTASFESGKLYKIQFDLFLISGTETRGNFYFEASEQFSLLKSTDKVGDTYTLYASPSANRSYFIIGGDSPNAFGDIFELDNISIKEVQMGNHATTNFFGDDLLEGYGDFSDATKWSGVDNGFSITGGQLVAVNAQNNVYRDIPTSVHTIENGKSYQATFTISDYVDGYVKFVVGGNDTGTLRSGDGTYTETITVTNRVNNFIYISTYDSPDLKVDDFTVKEVGISSSGFETAVNEPVIPQVPLMKYNQKMKFKSYSSGTTGQYVDVDIDSLSLGDFTISFWYNTDNPKGTFIGRATSSVIRFESTQSVFRVGSNNYYISGTTGTEIASGRFLTAIREGTSFKLYIDGILDSTTTVATDVWTFGTDARIGQSAWGNFDGTIHECSVFNTALNQTQIQELFNDGVALDATTHSKKDYLLGYWRNDGISSWVDRAPKKMAFDGIDDRVRYGNLINGFTSLTMASWFRVNTSSSTQNDIIGQFNNITTIGARLQSRAGSGGLWWATGSGSSSTIAIYYDSGAHRDGNWHHVVGTYDGSTLKLYFDGATTPVATASSSGLTFNDTNGFDIGGTYPEYMDGNIDECALWNTALTGTEVAELYALGLDGNILTHSNQTNLVSYWKNEGITTASWADKKGSNNPSSVAGSPTLIGGNNGNVQGSPDSITIREGLNSNRDGLGFYFTNPSSNVLRLNSNQSEYIRVPNSSVFNFSGDFAIEFWMKHEGNASNQYICSMGEGNSSTNTRFAVYLDSNDQIKASYDDGSSVVIATYDTGSEGAVVDNLWHHWVVNFEKSDKIKIYLDGDSTAKAQSSSIASLGALNTSLDLIVGALYHGNGGYFNGLLDELRFYSKILSADEINKNYKHQKGKHKND